MSEIPKVESIDARDYRESVAALLESLWVEFEMHWSGDDSDDYEGFNLSHDPSCDRTWYIVKNPFGGSNLEIAIEYGFDIVFGKGCWNFPPTVRGYRDFTKTISALLRGGAASVSCLIDARMSQAPFSSAGRCLI